MISFISYIKIIFVAIFWGGSFVATKNVLELVSPIEQLAARWTVAGLTVIMLYLFKIIKIDLKGKKVILLFGFALIQPCFYAIFETYGLKSTTASESSIIISLIPVVVAIISTFVLKISVRKTTILSIFMCILGVIFTVGFDNTGSSSSLTGYLFLSCAVLLGALYSVGANILGKSFTAVEITSAMSVVGGLFFNLLVYIQGGSVLSYIVVFTNLDKLFSILFLGTACSVICFLFYNSIVKDVPAAIVSVVIGSLTTFVGVFAGIFFNNDSFTIFKALGLVLIIVGVSITSMSKRKV